jgi:hypothetical protein
MDTSMAAVGAVEAPSESGPDESIHISGMNTDAAEDTERERRAAALRTALRKRKKKRAARPPKRISAFP